MIPAGVVDLILLGCNTGIDITHGMGEVTNAYIILRNPASPDQSEVCVTLSAIDEGRIHPNKTTCIQSLPGGYQVTVKLAIDSTFNEDTRISLDIITNEGFTIAEVDIACQDIGSSKPSPQILNVLQLIP
jgi:hypothetical protein